MKIAKTVNPVQKEFNRLCDLSGGPSGGPTRVRVLELLRSNGKSVSTWASTKFCEHLQACENANPWHVCFSFGLTWGHLSKMSPEFTQTAVRVLENWNGPDLSHASSFHLERGPEPIEKSLAGGWRLFQQVRLPSELPDTLAKLKLAQERWLGNIIGPNRPAYIGSWNATAMFMMALFAKPDLRAQFVESGPLLPPGGPAFNGLKTLFKAGILTKEPDGGELDESGFEPGVIYSNNELMATLCRGLEDWNLLDVHCGLYMLGTRYRSDASS